jgi:hypothetical protein
MEEKIMDALKNNGFKYKVYGIRTDDREFAIGDNLPNSRDTYWENDEERELDGTCATGFGYLWYDDDDMGEVKKALATHLGIGYEGAHMYLIAGTGFDYGDDEAEVIIENAQVVAILR